MGVQGLSKVVKASEGKLAYGLKTKEVHVDFLSVFFSFIQSHYYRITADNIAKEVKDSLECAVVASLATTIAQTGGTPSTVNLHSKSDTEYHITEGSSSKKRRATTPPSESSKRQKVESDFFMDVSSKKSNSALFIGEDGHVTPKPPQRRQVRWLDR
jgi:hypothetical protein